MPTPQTPLPAASCRHILEELRRTVGDDHVITDEGTLLAASLDSRRRRQGSALALVRPGSTGEVSAVVRLASREGLFVIAQGGNTSTVGGATPDPGSPANGRTILLQLSRMNRIQPVDTVNGTVTVEAGAVLERVQEAARSAGRLFPVSLAARGSAQIGGVLAANAGGIHVVRYGMARRSCLGLEVVLADGRVLDLMRSVRKDNAGYDLRDLFIGSEGTLGIITRAVLQLESLPAGRITLFASLGSLRSVERLFETVEDFAGPALAAFELISREALAYVLKPHDGRPGLRAPCTPADWMVLLDLGLSPRDMAGDPGAQLEAALVPLVEDGTLTDAAVATSEAQCEAFWRLREEIPTAVRAAGGNIKNDISVPRGSLCSFIEETYAAFRKTSPWLVPVVFGHYGDGNLHFNLGSSPEFERGYWKRHEQDVHRYVNDTVVRYGGSVAAEHGVGAKAAVLERVKAPLELELMTRIRAALDPAGTLNPGRVVRWPRDAWRNPDDAWD